jgi:hypothetical protein
MLQKKEIRRNIIFSRGPTAQFWALAASMKLYVLFRLQDLGQSAWLLERLISSSQGLCVSAPGDCEDGEVGGIKIGRGSRSIRRKPAPTPFVHDKSHLPDPGAKSGCRGGKPTTNRFSYGAGLEWTLINVICSWTGYLDFTTYRYMPRMNSNYSVILNCALNSFIIIGNK